VKKEGLGDEVMGRTVRRTSWDFLAEKNIKFFLLLPTAKHGTC
jgi:hypothetical protein